MITFDTRPAGRVRTGWGRRTTGRGAIGPDVEGDQVAANGAAQGRETTVTTRTSESASFPPRSRACRLGGRGGRWVCAAATTAVLDAVWSAPGSTDPVRISSAITPAASAAPASGRV